MRELIATQIIRQNAAFSLTESQRELLPIAFGSFLDSVSTATGRDLL